MIDLISYLLGHKKGVTEGTMHVEIDGKNLTCADDGEGSITVTVTETEGE